MTRKGARVGLEQMPGWVEGSCTPASFTWFSRLRVVLQFVPKLGYIIYAHVQLSHNELKCACQCGVFGRIALFAC